MAATKTLPTTALEVVAIPLELAWQDPRTNLESMRTALARLSSPKGARLVIFPELTLTGFTTVNPIAAALDPSDKILAKVRSLALEFKCSLVFGYPERTNDGRVKNALSYISSQGQELGRYYKLHLFTQGTHPETATYMPGDQPICVNDGDWRIGLAICFDLRFPELFRSYAKAGCDLMVLSACWVGGPTKHNQFMALASGQAVISQSFMVALNRTGSDPFCQFEGEAAVFGPRAERLAYQENAPAITVLDPALLKAARGLSVLPSLRSAY